MIRTGEEYRSSLDDGREVWINGQRVEDICSHPQLKPVIDVRSRIYDCLLYTSPSPRDRG